MLINHKYFFIFLFKNIFNIIMIRFSFLIIAIISLVYGFIFLITPNWFVDFSMAEDTNIAWLRSIGSSIIGLLFFGCFSIYYKPHGKLSLLKIITITNLIQTSGLIYSRVYNEFSAKNLLVIDLTIFLAIFVCIYFVWLILYKSYKFK